MGYSHYNLFGVNHVKCVWYSCYKEDGERVVGSASILLRKLLSLSFIMSLLSLVHLWKGTSETQTKWNTKEDGFRI